MGINRRELLAGAAAISTGSALFSDIAAAQVPDPRGGRTTLVRQGALSGGGFDGILDIADDGSMLLGYDGANCWKWNEQTQQFDNVFAQDRVPPAFQMWGLSRTNMEWMGARAVAFAPRQSSRAYVVATGTAHGYVWRSDNGCASWVDTGYRLSLGVHSPRGTGPNMAVDPANPDIVYISDEAGVIHRSFNGGATWERILYKNLMTAVANKETKQGQVTLFFADGTIPPGVVDTIDPVTRKAWRCAASDPSAPMSEPLSGITRATYVSKTTSTSVTLNAPLADRNIVGTGDTIVFGGTACICFDRSSPVVDRKTQGIYIGWRYGASAIVRSTDGGTNFNVMPGSPGKIKNLHVTNDGVVFACDELKAVTNSKNLWRYQSGAWANLPVASEPNQSWQAVASDARNPGHVAVVKSAGGVKLSPDHGRTWHDAASVRTRRVAKDVPWLGEWSPPSTGTIEDWMSAGTIVFDPAIPNRLWFAEGVGLWHSSPDFRSVQQYMDWNSRNKNQQGLIVTKIVKPPGQALIMSVQDRAGVRCPNPIQEPAGDMGIFESPQGGGGALKHGWSVDYAKTDPSVQFALVNVNPWKSTDGGVSWNPRPVKNPGLANMAQLAAQTANNWVVFSSGRSVYTVDDGANYVDCLFNGVKMPFGGGTSHILVADPNGSQTYYAFYRTAHPMGSKGAFKITVHDAGAGYKQGDTLRFATGNVSITVASVDGRGGITSIMINNSGNYRIPEPKNPIAASGGSGSGASFDATWSNTGGLWRSTDSGANWTNMTPTWPQGMPYFHCGYAQLVAVPGHRGHFMLSSGSYLNEGGGLFRTVDEGVTWQKVNGVDICFQAAPGKAAPGKNYPAIFMSGILAADPDPGIFRSDDFSTDPNARPTWTRLCRAPGGNMDGSSSLCGDSEEYGTFYIACGGTGYAFGKLQ